MRLTATRSRDLLCRHTLSALRDNRDDASKALQSGAKRVRRSVTLVSIPAKDWKLLHHIVHCPEALEPAAGQPSQD